MHHAVANADTNYHIGPKHDNATSVFEALGWCCRGDTNRADDQSRLVSGLAESATTYSARAIDLVQRCTVVDMLNPFTLLGVLAPFKADKRPTWFTNPETFTSADFQRF
jgi:hypothetical protein